MIIEGRAESIGQLLEEADRICRAFKADFHAREEIWFRGQPSRELSLTPLLYRADVARYHYNEAALLDRFIALARPMCSIRPTTDWEWYFLGRHHGLPSRLLDWTESLLSAAFFALVDRLPKDRLELDQLLQTPTTVPSAYDHATPVVWILDAGSLNDVSLKANALVVPPGERSNPYLPRALETRSSANALPIAVLPPRTSGRIVAQQGLFTVHGFEELGIDEIAAAHPDLKLGAVRLDSTRTARMLAELRVAGVNRLSLFPDLDSVADHVCWFYQSTT